MSINIRRMTLQEFETFIYQPENLDRNYEFITGEIFEVVSNSSSSEIAMTIGAMITVFVKQKKLGRVTGADGGYIVGDERLIPDVGFVSYAHQPEDPHAAYNPIAPDLAVEVLSPSDSPYVIRLKIASYTHAGTTVWLIDPEQQTVEIYSPDAPPQSLDNTGTLDGGEILPGFTLTVKDIFPPQSGEGTE